MSRRGPKTLTLKPGEALSENTPNATPKKDEKPGFFARLFGGNKTQKPEPKHTAAKTKRVRRPSKLADEENDVEALRDEINQRQEKIRLLEEQTAQLPPPPPPPPTPPPPPPPPPPKIVPYKEQKLKKIVGDNVNVGSNMSLHDELMNAIKNQGRARLRRVSIRRSLGGTPIREKKEFAPVTDTDILVSQMVVRDPSSDESLSEDEDAGF